MTTPTGVRFVCPTCRTYEALYSVEVAEIMYAARFTAADPADHPNGIALDYTGADTVTLDEGTEYAGKLYCRGCSSELTETDLVPDPAARESSCRECGDALDPADFHAGHGMCGPCLHDALRSGWEPSA